MGIYLRNPIQQLPEPPFQLPPVTAPPHQVEHIAVAPVAGLTLPAASLQLVRHQLQHSVAELVAHKIINRLHAPDIHHDHGQLLQLILPHQLQHVKLVFFQVAQPRQGVRIRQVVYLLLGLQLPPLRIAIASQKQEQHYPQNNSNGIQDTGDPFLYHISRNHIQHIQIADRGKGTACQIILGAVRHCNTLNTIPVLTYLGIEAHQLRSRIRLLPACQIAVHIPCQLPLPGLYEHPALGINDKALIIAVKSTKVEHGFQGIHIKNTVDAAHDEALHLNRHGKHHGIQIVKGRPLGIDNLSLPPQRKLYTRKIRHLDIRSFQAAAIDIHCTYPGKIIYLRQVAHLPGRTVPAPGQIPCHILHAGKDACNLAVHIHAVLTGDIQKFRLYIGHQQQGKPVPKHQDNAQGNRKQQNTCNKYALHCHNAPLALFIHCHH